MSRKKIAFQGMLGAYSHLACIENVNTHLPYPCTSFDEMIAAVQNGTADLAMVPVENSTAGRVDFGFLIRLPSLSMMPNLKASCFSKGVVNNFRNL